MTSEQIRFLKSNNMDPKDVVISGWGYIVRIVYKGNPLIYPYGAVKQRM